ncbi:hypothetical protein CQW23_24756 [Capsicum baccatum]|uniref:Legume lectin domain-containing protein n=1 Tax=Capsicum baccatum TaxID=33114 RepID=A0A2G2VVQ5_CAPBA|nr:hypothetical protein CQW23_24756 [Capsicum baccatum]
MVDISPRSSRWTGRDWRDSRSREKFWNVSPITALHTQYISRTDVPYGGPAFHAAGTGYRHTRLASHQYHIHICIIIYPSFAKEDANDLITTNHSYIAFGALQVTGDALGASITNFPGRIWLGIVNASTNGSSSNKIFATEFDTRKSYLDDLDDNHVGIDINSINSVSQVSLIDRGVNLSRAVDVIESVRYDGQSKILKVYTFMSNKTGENERNPIISMPLDLSSFLPEDVFVGFSASRAWNFTSTDIGNYNENNNGVSLLWLWILIPIISVLVMFLGGVFVYFTWRRKKKRMQVLGQDENIEIQIQNSATAPQRFQLKDLKRATGNFDPTNILGRGGCGVVLKGLLADSKEVSRSNFSGHDGAYHNPPVGNPTCSPEWLVTDYLIT